MHNCFAVVKSNMNNAINGERLATFHPIEDEIPATTEIQTVANSVITIDLDFQSCVVSQLLENAILEIKATDYSQFLPQLLTKLSSVFQLP